MTWLNCLPPRHHPALYGLLLPGAVLAQAASPASAPTTNLPPVVVTATRTEAQAFDVPASIDRIDAEQIRNGRAQVNLSESLGAVPGLLARDRQNYAQDVQISVRGFGARASFGIRGVRLYVDGIPATLPDGQGQISNVDLGSVGRIEVLRGPFSALYGNSSGGVVQVFTEEGSGPPQLDFSVLSGSDGQRRLSAKASGSSGSLGYVLSASSFRTDGYRDHSQTRRHLGNAKLSWRPDEDSKLTLVANALSLPQAQDPLGLTRAQFEANPRAVDPAALNFNTRKTVDQTQGGLVYERRLDAANRLQLMAYVGERGTVQFQSIPVATQANALHPGGVIDLARNYHGLDLRWTLTTRLLDQPLSLVSGLAHDRLEEQRRGYQNFVGSTLGVEGALRRNEANTVTATDPYVQAGWQLRERWTLNAGLRHSSVRFRSQDNYSSGSNPDDSGSARYSATLPVLGLLYALNEDVHLYTTAGRGFETPTLNELSYRPNGATGLNFGLQASRSSSLELGVKTRQGAWGALNAALFQTRTRNEIVTQTSLGGRATFQNAGATRRQGLELGWSLRSQQHLLAQLAFTTLDARYREGFSTCAGTPCTTPTQQIPAGKRIPGIARHSLFAGLSWAPPQGWRGGVELRALSQVPVNDSNSDAAAGHTLAAAHLGYQLTAGAWDLGSFVRVDNLFDRRSIGSVIVNEGNGRFFEPAPGRSWLLGASASLRF